MDYVYRDRTPYSGTRNVLRLTQLVATSIPENRPLARLDQSAHEQLLIETQVQRPVRLTGDTGI